jgi:apolipoprotein N-acyltransferase
MAVPVGTNGSGAATAPRRTGWSERLVLAVLSGGMLAAAFPSLDLGFLAWVALVPVLRVIRTLRVREAFATGWVAGLAFYVGGTYWVVYTIDHYTRLPLVVAVGLLLLMSSVLACYVGAFAAGVRWCDRRAGGLSWVVAPALWVTLEWVRGWFFIGFPWNARGYSQHRFHDLVQLAEDRRDRRRATLLYGDGGVRDGVEASSRGEIRPVASHNRSA